MSTLDDRKNALMVAMAAAMPGRVITRKLVDFSQRRQEDLEAGLVAIVGLGEGDYSPSFSRAADLGTLKLLLIGQLVLSEKSSPEEVEAAEDTLADEIKAFARSQPAGMNMILTGFTQSGQVEHPHGWIAFDAQVLM